MIILQYVGVYFAIAICTKVFLTIIDKNSSDLGNVILALVWPVTLLCMIFIWIIKTVFTFVDSYTDDMVWWWRRFLTIRKITKECKFDSEGQFVDTEGNWRIARNAIHKYHDCHHCPLCNKRCNIYKYYGGSKTESVQAIINWVKENT